jgi:nucleoside-diphosphate-sugar epimerase
MKKTVLVTGATGFLGSHLVKALLADGYRVAILKRSFSKTWRIDDVMDQVISFDLDICNLHQVFDGLDNVFAVIHTATCYGKNNEGLLEVLKANTFLPLQILDLATNFNVDIFINTDTYFKKGDIPYQGLPDYSISKKHFDDWGKYYAQYCKIFEDRSPSSNPKLATKRHLRRIKFSKIKNLEGNEKLQQKKSGSA